MLRIQAFYNYLVLYVRISTHYYGPYIPTYISRFTHKHRHHAYTLLYKIMCVHCTYTKWMLHYNNYTYL